MDQGQDVVILEQGKGCFVIWIRKRKDQVLGIRMFQGIAKAPGACMEIKVVPQYIVSILVLSLDLKCAFGFRLRKFPEIQTISLPIDVEKHPTSSCTRRFLSWKVR